MQLIVVTPRMEAAARDFFQLYRWKLEKMGFTLKTKGTQPSVGFVAAFALMQVCDRVSLYGFGRTHSDGSKLEKYRYFDSGKRSVPADEGNRVPHGRRSGYFPSVSQRKKWSTATTERKRP